MLRRVWKASELSYFGDFFSTTPAVFTPTSVEQLDLLHIKMLLVEVKSSTDIRKYLMRYKIFLLTIAQNAIFHSDVHWETYKCKHCILHQNFRNSNISYQNVKKEKIETLFGKMESIVFRTLPFSVFLSKKHAFLADQVFRWRDQQVKIEPITSSSDILNQT